MFFEAAARLMAIKPPRDIVFVVIGDGELRGELELLCRDKGLIDHVRFCGWVRNVAAVYADLDVLALTSLNEGTPVSIIEAMASSVPVIATDVGGVHDLLGKPREESGSEGFVVAERGILCNRNDSAGFAKGILSILEGNRRDTGNRVERACLFVQENYSDTRLLRDMESLYISLAGRKIPNLSPPLNHSGTGRLP
jgi:glycosyltransferase involved in cell wall biosynthesis